jgi:aconitate hydratase
MPSSEEKIGSTHPIGVKMTCNFFGARGWLTTNDQKVAIFKLAQLEKAGLTNIERLPFSIRIMLESLLRQCDEREISQQDVLNLARWQPVSTSRSNLPFRPARVVMQDFTGVPAIVDLAAMRSAVARLGGNPQRINPLVPVDLVIDHSVQVDFFAHSDALQRNAELEFQRNKERYEFLHWGQKAFSNFRVVPPATGIVHQVNLEFLASVVLTSQEEGVKIAFPDTLVGTDSHTTMINGLGVVGWGVGGIEAEAAMLGQPIDMLTPDVVGFKLYNQLSEGVTATDLVLTVTQMLRKKGVVEKFVEFFGNGLSSLSLPDRATIANMAPEYGATMGYFPVDDETLRYLRLTGRPAELVELVERYTKEQGLFHTHNTPDPIYSDTLELDLSLVEPSLAGPKRPQDRVTLPNLKASFENALAAPIQEHGYELNKAQIASVGIMGTNGGSLTMQHGAVVIAAITSCTNTSNPSVMIAAGLLAKKAIARGLKVKPYVKTSLAPGSRVVTTYLEKAGLLDPLAELGFNVVGFGCTTCIGNSGPLPGEVIKAISSVDLVAAAVISGNRNFEGRIHPYVCANYLVSPPLVVAFALAGTVDIDLTSEPIGTDRQGQPVYLRDLWPGEQEINQVIAQNLSPEIFNQKYANIFTGNETWNAIQAEASEIYPWKSDSTYIQEPPFFAQLSRKVEPIPDIHKAQVLVMLGDSITTDHISPAGAITFDSPAGQYLTGKGVQPRDFNSYGSRRGNDQVMTRGTFANIRLKNRLVPGKEGGITLHIPSQKVMSIFEAATQYQQEQIPLIVLAGKEYGAGSSRDWAAKGTLLLGIKAVIAESYERIHRSNLVGMGVLPLQFLPGDNCESLGLTGQEQFSITGLEQNLKPGKMLEVEVQKSAGKPFTFQALARLDTFLEINYYKNRGILHTILRNII